VAISSVLVKRQKVGDIEEDVAKFRTLNKSPYDRFKLFDPKGQVKALAARHLPASMIADSEVK
jgi:hypothetical protein